MKRLFSSASRRNPAAEPAAPRRVAKPRLGDFALFFAGATMAAAAVVFAHAMLTQADPRPRINGMQYLAIFAQPRGSSPAAAAAPPPARRVAEAGVDKAPTGALGRDALDKTPTGAIAPSVDDAPTGAIAPAAGDASPSAPNYRIVAAEPGMAWLSDGSQIRVVRPGDVAPGLARVAAIVRRDGRWALLDETGAALLTSDGSEEKGRAALEGPFTRRMIFNLGD